MHIAGVLLCAATFNWVGGIPVEGGTGTGRRHDIALKRDSDISINYDLLDSRDSNVLACRIVGYSGDKCDGNQGSAIQIPKSVEGMLFEQIRE
jgi:hypothetical protein